ncbi:MAG TPA: prolyl oligopeptidase family serine peptidase, partial [Thermoanaerobaculia bacterium]
MLERVALVLSLVSAVALAQESETYQMPPKEIADLVDAPLTPGAITSPDQKWILLVESPPLLTMEDLSQPELKLAGLRFNPQTNDQTRPGYFRKLSLVESRSGKTREIAFPANPRARNITWSPDGTRFAFTLSGPSGVELWTGDVATATATRLGSFLLNSVHPSRPYHWVSDSQHIIARTLPNNLQQADKEAVAPSGPVIQESAGRKAPARTYQDLLKTPYDADLFEHHIRTQVVRVALDGATKGVAVGTITRAEPSPDGKSILVEAIHRPYSYLVPEFRFPRLIQILDADGKLVRQIADLPLADAVPTDFSSAPEGPRGVGWRTDHPATVYWIEAQDKGNPRIEAKIRDCIYTLASPFDGKPSELAALELRYNGIEWGGDDLALIDEFWWKTRKTRTWRVAPANASAKPVLLFDRSFEDRYSDPGSPVLEKTKSGTSVLKRGNKGKSLFFFGDGASSEGDRPFVDEMDVATRKTTRLWRSEAPNYEFAIEMLDDEGRKILTRRESVSEPPNYYVRDLRRKTLDALTSFPHPTPQLASAKKELLRYERSDGVKLTGTLYLPPNYDPEKDGTLPVLMWAYPQEFKSADAAGQVTDSPYRFIRVSSGSPLFWLVRGYAILDDPSIPIIGEGDKEPNDTYVEQLVSGAQAAIDEVVKRGVGDRKRVAIGGHSYGAFMTANLLAHSDLFRAGIARSGAYNRTLTPFSFQAEERTFWEAADTYIKMSPFTHAQKINEPILLIHGIDDNNTGTFPIQSERLYQALKGLGGTSRLVM